jgi:copper(I)-binding protein
MQNNHTTSAVRSLCLSAVLLLMGVLPAVFGCSFGEPKVSVENPRGELSPLFLGVASVYLTVRNDGGSDRLVNARVAVPKAIVELHDVKRNRMEKVSHFPVPSRGVLQLKPGGMHIMVFNLPRDTVNGAEFGMTLVFERSGERTVTVQVEAPGKPAGPSGG